MWYFVAAVKSMMQWLAVWKVYKCQRMATNIAYNLIALEIEPILLFPITSDCIIIL